MISRKHNRHGYTLIEMIVVTMVLLIMAGMILPNVVSISRSRQLFAFESAISRAPLEAKNEAVRSQMPVSLRVDGNTLVMERVDDQNNKTEFRRVSFGDELQVVTARQGANNGDVASWTWTVYPDGSSDTGGLTFSEGNQQKSLIFAKNGATQWITGDLPDTGNEQWQAGELQQRGG